MRGSVCLGVKEARVDEVSERENKCKNSTTFLQDVPSRTIEKMGLKSLLVYDMKN